MALQVNNAERASDTGAARTNVDVLIELLDLVEAMESDHRLPASPIPDLEFPSFKQLVASRKVTTVNVN